MATDLDKLPQMKQGKNVFLMFRRLKDQADENAKKLVFQTSHTFDMSRSNDAVNTKDGTLFRVGALESSYSIEAIQSTNDPTYEMLRNAVKNGEKLELWEITFEEDMKDEEGKYPAVYAQGYLESWSTPNDVEGEATISTTFNVEMVPQEGFATVTDEIAEQAQYAFRDTLAGSGTEETP